MLLEELREDPLDLDAGGVPFELDAARWGALQPGKHVGLELGMGSGSFEVGQEARHRQGREWSRNMATNVFGSKGGTSPTALRRVT